MSEKWSILSSIKIIGIGVLQLSLLAQILQGNDLNLLTIAIIGLLIQQRSGCYRVRLKSAARAMD